MQGSGIAKAHLACVKLSLNPDGWFCLRTGSVDVGTGSETSLRQIAAHVLGVTVADIGIIAADTHNTPFDAGSYASATLYISGQATKLAAEKLRTQLLEVAAVVMETHPEEATIANGTICTKEKTLSLRELAEAIIRGQGPRVRGQGPGVRGQESGVRGQEIGSGSQGAGEEFHPSSSSSSSSSSPLPILEAESEYTADESTLTFVVQAVEVQVDTETGKVEVLRSVQAIDLGKAINPRICIGQAAGGNAMGLGYALMEEQVMDDRGAILNPNFRTYRIPMAADMPPMEIILVETGDPYGPFGAREWGKLQQTQWLRDRQRHCPCYGSLSHPVTYDPRTCVERNRKES